MHRAGIAVSMMLIGLMVTTGCKPREAGFTPPPPPEVTVAQPIQATLPKTLEYTGTTRGAEQVDVRARVRGFIRSKSVFGGEKVKVGDLLFVIDPRPFEATVRQAQAEVSSREAQLRLAQITLDRKSQSAAGDAISPLELAQATADRDNANAQVELAKAKLTSAQLDLDYTNIRAPIDGRVSIDVPDIGELVGDTTSEVLCRIINDSTIFVTFSVPERVVLELRKQNSYQRPGEAGRPDIPIFVGFANDAGFPFAGKYLRGEPGFDPATGTNTIEGIIENADGRIVAGAFARIKSVVGTETVMLVPDLAVAVDQRGRYVLAVNDQGIVERVDVEVGDVVDRMRKITSGLTLESKVIVNGLQRARPGMNVKTTPTALTPPKLDIAIEATTAPSTQPGDAASTQPATQGSF